MAGPAWTLRVDDDGADHGGRGADALTVRDVPNRWLPCWSRCRWCCHGVITALVTPEPPSRKLSRMSDTGVSVTLSPRRRTDSVAVGVGFDLHAAAGRIVDDVAGRVSRLGVGGASEPVIPRKRQATARRPPTSPGPGLAAVNAHLVGCDCDHAVGIDAEMGRLLHHDVRTVALQPERAREVLDVVLVVEGLPEPLREVAARGAPCGSSGVKVATPSSVPVIQNSGPVVKEVTWNTAVFATPARVPWHRCTGSECAPRRAGDFGTAACWSRFPGHPRLRGRLPPSARRAQPPDTVL